MSIQRARYERRRPIPRKKMEVVRELAGLLERYNYVILVNITGVTAPVLHKSREILRREGSIFKVVKNTLMSLALRQVKDEKPGLEALEEYLKGQNAVIFTNSNPFEVKLFLDRNKIPREARSGDVATKDILIPAGNTNFQPGPILSLLNRLKIPIRIREGSIWVTADVVVAKAGDVISSDLAELLNKLGIKPIEVGLDVKAIYLDGRIVVPEEVELDPEIYRKRLLEARTEALSLAVSIAYPEPEVLSVSLRKAHLEALALAVEAGYPTRESIGHTIARAEAGAAALYNLLKNKM